MTCSPGSRSRPHWLSIPWLFGSSRFVRSATASSARTDGGMVDSGPPYFFIQNAYERNRRFIEKCGGWDSNPRRPVPQGSKLCTARPVPERAALPLRPDSRPFPCLDWVSGTPATAPILTHFPIKAYPVHAISKNELGKGCDGAQLTRVTGLSQRNMLIQGYGSFPSSIGD